MKLLFTGDICFEGKGILSEEDVRGILKNVMPVVRAVDFCIPNLETPLADKEKHTPIKKSGPNLISPKENAVFLSEMGAHAVTLANNHTGDYGESAVKETLDLLDSMDIFYAGAGKDLDDAYTPMYFEKDGVKVGVISICENEFGTATEHGYGAACYQARYALRAIREAKENADFAVVVFHGGNEYNPLPSPDTVERYRLLCDMGADAIVGGHTHCPQGYEIYEGKPIVYSMGNFYFASLGDGLPADNSWHYGYMTVLSCEKGKGIALETVPYNFNIEATEIKVFEGEEKAAMLAYLEKISALIANPEELQNHFYGWVLSHHYYWCPKAPASLEEEDLQNYKVTGNLNLMRCESHSFLSRTFFRMIFDGKIDVARAYVDKVKALQIMPV